MHAEHLADLFAAYVAATRNAGAEVELGEREPDAELVRQLAQADRLTDELVARLRAQLDAWGT